jgi:lysozyme family protein
MATFEEAFEQTLRWEGGVSNDPSDPGGYTKFGISQKAYPDLNIKALTKAQAQEIYRRDYWDPFQFEEMEQAKANVLFDFAVNAGPGRAVKLAQYVSGADIDGIVGPNTLGCISESANFVVDFTLGRVQYYARLAEAKPALRKFFLGWVKRALSFT